MFDHEYLYIAYADNTSFFLEGITSIKVVLKDLNWFYRSPDFGLISLNAKYQE